MNYELTLLARSDVSVDDVSSAIGNIAGIIASTNSEILYSEYWGLRDLAYPIAKKNSAHYYFVQYKSDQETNDLLSSRLKISDVFIRHMIVRIDDESVIGKKTPNIVESKSNEDSGIIFDEKYFNVLKSFK